MLSPSRLRSPPGFWPGFVWYCLSTRHFFRTTSSELPKLFAPLHDLPVGALVIARLLPKRREGPRGLRVIALDLAFTAAVRVIHRVHGHAANGRFAATPTRASGLAVGLVLMVEVAHLADRRHAIDGKLANFAGSHLNQREFALLAQQLRRPPRGTHCLPA